MYLCYLDGNFQCSDQVFDKWDRADVCRRRPDCRRSATACSSSSLPDRRTSTKEGAVALRLALGLVLSHVNLLEKMFVLHSILGHLALSGRMSRARDAYWCNNSSIQSLQEKMPDYILVRQNPIVDLQDLWVKMSRANYWEMREWRCLIQNLIENTLDLMLQLHRTGKN